MSEVKNYITALDEWTVQEVFKPLWKGFTIAATEEEMRDLQLAVCKVIRDKVLESYRNGQKAPQRGKNRPYKRF